MEIAGVVRSSFIDYPGKIAGVVFTQGCNLRCSYCHNRELIDGGARCSMTPQEVLAWLETRRGLLDAVVVTGGEPTFQPDLVVFIEQVRRLDYLVKLDTNGTRPTVLAFLMYLGLLDYVAMDIKAPVEKYDAICGVTVDQGAIDKSIELLISGHVEYEFRTTIVPQLTREDILAIAHRIHGANSYVLQRYRHVQADESSRRPPSPFGEYAPSWLEDVWYYLNQTVTTCCTRGFEIGPAQPD